MGVVCRCWSHALLRIGIVFVHCVLAAYLAIRKLGSLTQPEQKHKHESPLHPQGGETAGRFFRRGGGVAQDLGELCPNLELEVSVWCGQSPPRFRLNPCQQHTRFQPEPLEQITVLGKSPFNKILFVGQGFSTKSFLLARAPSTKCLFRLDPLRQNPRFWPELFQNKFARRQGSCNKMSVFC